MYCIGIIWNRAIEYEDEISLLLSASGRIIKEEKLDLSYQFDEFVTGIYFDSKPSHVRSKLKALKTVLPRVVKIIELDLIADDYFFSTEKGFFVYKSIEDLKEKIRRQIRCKIPDYYFDIVFHLTDNQYEYERTQRFLLKFLESYSLRREND